MLDGLLSHQSHQSHHLKALCDYVYVLCSNWLASNVALAVAFHQDTTILAIYVLDVLGLTHFTNIAGPTVHVRSLIP